MICTILIEQSVCYPHSQAHEKPEHLGLTQSVWKQDYQFIHQSVSHSSFEQLWGTLEGIFVHSVLWKYTYIKYLPATFLPLSISFIMSFDYCFALSRVTAGCDYCDAVSLQLESCQSLNHWYSGTSTDFVLTAVECCVVDNLFIVVCICGCVCTNSGVCISLVYLLQLLITMWSYLSII